MEEIKSKRVTRSPRIIHERGKETLRLNKEYLQYAANPAAIKPRSASTTSSSLATVRPSIVPSLKTELTVLR